MSNDVEKQQLDMPSAGTTDSTEAAVVDDQGTKGKGRGFSWALVLAVIALIALLAISAAAYFYLNSVQQELRDMARRVDESTSGQDRLSTELQTLSNRLVGQAEKIGHQQATFDEYAQLFRTERDHYELGRKEMLESVNSVQRRMGRSSSRWMAAEAEYLIRVANYQVQLEGDVTTALSALKSADERLRDSGDPLWTPVRNQLAVDIAALQAIQPLDREGISARLFALSRQVEKMKLSGALLSHPKKIAEQDSQPEFSFDRLLQDGIKGFKSLLVVRHHDRPVAAMLAPEREFFLGHNMRLQLESARLALLRRDQQLFDTALKTAREWLEAYYDLEDAGVTGMRDSLNELAGTQVRKELPDISASLALITKKTEESDTTASLEEKVGGSNTQTSPATPSEGGKAETTPSGAVKNQPRAVSEGTVAVPTPERAPEGKP